MSGFSDYTTLLPRKEGGEGSGQGVGSLPYTGDIKHVYYPYLYYQGP